MDPSLVNYLTSKGMDSSPEARATLYEKNGLGTAADYTAAHQATLAGTGDNSSQNTALLNKLRGGPANPLVVTGKAATNEFNTHSTDLNNLLTQMNTLGSPAPQQGNDPTIDNTSDSYTQMLDRLSANSSAATKALVSSIQANRSQKGATIDAQYDNYKRGLQQLGIEHNQAQFTPDLLSGHIQQAENEHQQKIQSLDVEEQKAFMDAEKAQAAGDLSTLKDKMAYVKDLRTQKQDYLKNIASNMTAEGTIAKDQVANYYDKLTKLNPADQEEFLKQVSQKYGIGLGALTNAIVAEKAARDKADLATANSKATLAKKQAGGSGTGGSFKNSVQIPQVTTVFEKNKGTDGFVDPYAWVKARTIWQTSGGTAASFNSNFKSYLNPQSYSIAGFKG